MTPREQDEFGARFARLITNRLFGEVVKRLERGVHICPDDGEAYYFVRRHCDDLSAYFAIAFGSELVDRNWFHLEGNQEIYGRRQLASRDVVTGTVLAHSFHSPERLRSGGIPLESFFEDVRNLLGGGEAFVTVYHRRPKAGGSEQRRTERAEEECLKSIRRLSRLGFARSWSDATGHHVDPREPCHRFAEVVRLSPDAGDAGLMKAIDQLVRSGRLADPEAGGEEAEAGDDET